YIVLDAGETKYLKKGTVLDLGSAKVSLKSREQLLKTLEDVKLKVEEGTIYEKKVNRMLDQLREPNVPFSVEEVVSLISKFTSARFGIGAAAIEQLLSEIDLDSEIEKIRNEIKVRRGSSDQSKLTKRIEVLDSLRRSNSRPE